LLIYNHEKQMVGVDETTLKQIGYDSLNAFLKEHSDIADLFVKKPGYVHKFQNFSWIDFVQHAEADETKVIVMNGHKQFSCTLDVSPLYMTASPDEPGYLVDFQHIRSLHGAAMDSTAPVIEESAIPINSEPDLPMDTLDDRESTILEEPDLFDIPDGPPMSIPDINPDGSLDVSMDFDKPSAPTPKEKPMLGDYINPEEKAFIDNLQTAKSYAYDPHVAADELGLPVELIEEFIGDFIQQAHEFKTQLFDAALKEDFDEAHVLSHKLKGVAANLRVEDAFEVLSIINNSRDQIETEANLKQFYRIIAKMEGEEVPELMAAEASTKETQAPELPDEDDDIYDLGFTLDEPDETITLKESTPPPVKADDKTDDMFALTLPDDDDSDDNMLDNLYLPPDDGPEEEPITLQPATPQEPETTEEPKVETGTSQADKHEPLHYDMKKAAMELDLKQEFVNELCMEFKQEAEAKKEALLLAIDQQDFRRIQSMAFEFKGLSDNLRIDQLSETLKTLIRENSAVSAKEEAERFYQLLKQI